MKTTALTERTFTTANGIPVYVYSNPGLHTFCLSLTVKAGPLYEKKKNIGITHAWEHMVGRNLNRVYGENIDRFLDKKGIRCDFRTNWKRVRFEFDGTDAAFETAAETAAKIFEPFVVSPDDLQAEKNRIKAEALDEYAYSIHRMARYYTWSGARKLNDVIGDTDDIKRFTCDDFAAFQAETLTAENCFFYITGNVTDEQIHYLTGLVGAYRLRQGVPKDNTVKVPKRFFNRNCQLKIYDYPYAPSSVLFSFDVDTAKYTKAELDILTGVLFGKGKGMMFDELSEKTGLLYDFHDRNLLFNNIGVITCEFDVAPKKLTKVIKKIISVGRRIKSVMPETVETEKRGYVLGANAWLDSAIALNDMMSDHRTAHNYAQSVTDRAQNHAQVTPERIAEIAREILVPAHMLVCVHTDTKKFDKKKTRKILMEI